MNLNEIDAYLSASRGYIEDAKRRIGNMGFCCPAMLLGDLEKRQIELERMAWNERHKDGSLGIWWFGVAAIGVATSYIAAYVYDHFTAAKTTSEYTKCLEKYQASPYNRTPEQAKELCTGGNDKADITATIKIAIYGGVAIMALYVVSKFLGKKK
jgi:hypothetical protein